MKFVHWLEREASGAGKVFFILILPLMLFVYTGLLFGFLNGEWFVFPEAKPGYKGNYLIATWQFFPLLYYIAFVEEGFFRFIPLYLVVDGFGTNSKAVILAIIFSSLMFAFCHQGIVSLPFQGVAGVMFCITYLKCGGGQDKHLSALFASTTMHFTFNSLLALLILWSGNTTF